MIHRDAGLSALAIVARLHGKSLDPEQVRHELAIEGPAKADDLLRAARRNGFKAVLDKLDLRCTRAPLPCLVELKDGAGFAVLAKLDGPRALIHRDGRPRALELDALQAELSGRALFIDTRAPSPLGLARSGFRWFVPAIAKYRRLSGEALVASLALIVDKVRVHKGPLHAHGDRHRPRLLRVAPRRRHGRA